MRTNTSQRIPIYTGGDLDGYVFSLSPDAHWLLFTRKAEDSSENINRLWIQSTDDPKSVPISLNISNITQYADWIPGSSLRIAYSTVEPRDIAPGWQANNDLFIVTIDRDGKVTDQEEILAANAGGVYGWWGTTFSWSPNGEHLYYLRPDSIGEVSLTDHTLSQSINILPYKTSSDWAWVPNLAWTDNTESVLYIAHNPLQGFTYPESSPQFDLFAYFPLTNRYIPLFKSVGMFSSVSITPEGKIVFLKTLDNLKSDSSLYELWMMDRDGSNSFLIFPSEGQEALSPQKIGKYTIVEGKTWVAFLSNNDLYLYDIS
jgi:hypothetical protein